MITTKINDVIEKFENQHFYSEKVGVYLLNLPGQTVLFDLPTFSLEIKKYLSAKKKPLTAFLSHGSCGIADGSKWQKELSLKVYLHQSDANHAWLMMKPDVLFERPPQIDEQLQLIHTPGHSPGSMCLLEKKTKTLFSGDTFGGTSDGAVRDFTQENHQYDDIPERLLSSKKLLKYDFKHILPFHYEPIMEGAKEALETFIEVKGR